MSTHKVLVYKLDGSLGRVELYRIDEPRPEPADQSYIVIGEDNPIYIDKVLGQDIGTIAFSKSYWDFANSAWVWGHNRPEDITLESSNILKQRDIALAKSAYDFIHCKSQDDIDALVDYRQKLRNLETTLADCVGEDIKLPRTPNEIAQIKLEASRGDLVSQQTVEEEGL